MNGVDLLSKILDDAKQLFIDGYINEESYVGLVEDLTDKLLEIYKRNYNENTTRSK